MRCKKLQKSLRLCAAASTPQSLQTGDTEDRGVLSCGVTTGRGVWESWSSKNLKKKLKKPEASKMAENRFLKIFFHLPFHYAQVHSPCLMPCRKALLQVRLGIVLLPRVQWSKQDSPLCSGNLKEISKPGSSKLFFFLRGNNMKCCFFPIKERWVSSLLPEEQRFPKVQRPCAEQWQAWQSPKDSNIPQLINKHGSKTPDVGLITNEFMICTVYFFSFHLDLSFV